MFSKLSPSNSEKCNHFVEAFARRLFISNWQQDCAVSRPMTGLWPSPIFVGNHLILRSASSLLALHCHWYVFCWFHCLYFEKWKGFAQIREFQPAYCWMELLMIYWKRSLGPIWRDTDTNCLGFWKPRSVCHC